MSIGCIGDTSGDSLLDQAAKLDTCSDVHVVNDARYMLTLDRSKRSSFKVVGSYRTDSKGSGPMNIVVNHADGTPRWLHLREVAYMPTSPFNLLSTNSLEKDFGLFIDASRRALVNSSGHIAYNLLKVGTSYYLTGRGPLCLPSSASRDDSARSIRAVTRLRSSTQREGPAVSPHPVPTCWPSPNRHRAPGANRFSGPAYRRFSVAHGFSYAFWWFGFTSSPT